MVFLIIEYVVCIHHFSSGLFFLDETILFKFILLYIDIVHFLLATQSHGMIICHMLSEEVLKNLQTSCLFVCTLHALNFD